MTNELACEDCKKLFCNSCLKAHSKHKKILLPTSLFQNYHFIDFLGRGTFGKVFSVIDISSGCKLIENVGSQDSDLILKELQIHQKLIHPNVIRFWFSKYLEENNQEMVAIFLELADTSLKSLVNLINQEEAFHYFVD